MKRPVTKEVWRRIESAPAYQISNLGHIVSFQRRKTLPMRLQLRPDGYIQVALRNNGKYKKHRVHVLVMEAFHGQRPAKMDVNHKDGNKQNNCLNNLEWISRSDNHRHAFRLGLAKPRDIEGEKHHLVKLTNAGVIDMREQYAQGVSRRALAVKYGVTYFTVWDITTRRSWKHI